MRKVRIIGAGLTGCVVAHLLREKYRVELYEKENHLGGLCWTDRKAGLLYNPYGLHVFHTKKKWLWDFMERFVRMRRLVYRTKTNVWGQVVDYPVNRNTIENLREAKQIKKELATLPKELNKTNLETCLISMVGPTLYDLIFRGYNQKMWGRPVNEMNANLISRIEIRQDNDDRYFKDEYQGYPKTGFNPLFEKLTQDFKVILNCGKIKPQAGDIVTAPPDEYFNYCYGELEWRGIKVRTEVMNIPWFQEVPLIYQPTSQYQWVKVSEPKHLTGQVKPYTLVCFETPSPQEKYYPVYTQLSLARLVEYQKLAKRKKITLCGRLGSYRYLNMDECIKQAYQVAREFL